MCIGHSPCDATPLTFETMLTDPMIRLMMDSDGVSTAELTSLLYRARSGVSAVPSGAKFEASSHA